MTNPIPDHMQAILLDTLGGPLRVGHKAVPQPGPGEVLVKIAAAPINPSDFGFQRGSYGKDLPFPVVPGFEGSGTVVAAGPGLLPRLWLGRRVVCAGPVIRDGTWAEYMRTRAASCVPLARHISFEQGAMLIVNPMTVIALFEIARQGRHGAIISNAAASALGRMVLRLALRRGIPAIHIVRRDEQVALLRSLGGEHVLNSAAPDFEDKLRALASRLNATFILDPVGGDATARLLDAAPAGSHAITYGSLSGDRATVEDATRNRITGFLLPDWLGTKNPLQILAAMWQVQRQPDVFQSTIQKRLPLADFQQGIDLYQQNPTAGKILLVADPDAVPVDA